VALQPGLELAGGAVRRGVRARVALLAVREGLDQRRALAGARACGGLGGGGVDLEDGVAVDAGTRHRVAVGPVGESLDRRRPRDRRVLAVEVVLAYEDRRELPDGGEVQRLVEGGD